MVECMEELSLVSAGGFRSKHDDFLDTISMLGMMNIWKPSDTNLERLEDESGLWNWHEDTGLSGSSYIV